MKEVRDFLRWVETEVRRVEGIIEKREAAYSRIPSGALVSMEVLEAVIAANEVIYTNALRRERQKILERVKGKAKELAEKYRARVEIQTYLEYDHFFKKSEGPRITRVSIRIPLVQNPNWDSENVQFREYVLNLETNEYYEHEFLNTTQWNYRKAEWKKPFNEKHIVIV